MGNVKIDLYRFFVTYGKSYLTSNVLMLSTQISTSFNKIPFQSHRRVYCFSKTNCISLMYQKRRGNKNYSFNINTR